MAQEEPKTPVRPSTDGEDLVLFSLHSSSKLTPCQDTFEDSTDITPRPRTRSPHTTRSLTDRPPSSASTSERSQVVDKDKNKENDTSSATDPVQPAERKPLPKRLSATKMESLDDVNLMDGMLTLAINISSLVNTQC